MTLTALQIQLGRAMGLSNPNSANDLAQINAFAGRYGISNVNSQRDIDQLTPHIRTPYETSPGSNTWVNPNNVLPNAGSYAGAPRATGGLPGAAADGTSTPSALDQLLMQQQQALAAQQQQFQLAQQQFAQEQALQQAAMQAQLQAAANSANASTPGAVRTQGQARTGWRSNATGRSELEALLLGTQAVTGALNSMVIA